MKGKSKRHWWNESIYFLCELILEWATAAATETQRRRSPYRFYTTTAPHTVPFTTKLLSSLPHHYQTQEFLLAEEWYSLTYRFVNMQLQHLYEDIDMQGPGFDWDLHLAWNFVMWSCNPNILLRNQEVVNHTIVFHCSETVWLSDWTLGLSKNLKKKSQTSWQKPSKSPTTSKFWSTDGSDI